MDQEHSVRLKGSLALGRWYEEGFFPSTFDKLRGVRLSVQYAYFSMFALWNELEMAKLDELYRLQFKGKALRSGLVEDVIARWVENKLHPTMESEDYLRLMSTLVKAFKNRCEFSGKMKAEVNVDNEMIDMYCIDENEGLYIPFSGTVFSWVCIKDEEFCSHYHMSKRTLVEARSKLKSLGMIDQKKSKNMNCYTFIPPINDWMLIPFKIFYSEEILHGSKVVYVWLIRFLNQKGKGEWNRMNFKEFSGFRNEKTLSGYRNQLMHLFPDLKELLMEVL